MVGITGFGVGGALNARRVAMDPPAKPEAAAVDTSRGYPVGNGSFSSQVRGTSPQPKLDLQFALMANDAYRLNARGPTGTQSERELAEAGWTRLTPVGNGLIDAQGHQIPIAPNLLHDPKTGFDAAIYQNEQGQYVVAYRGTDNWSPGEGGDATANGGQGLGLSTRQYEQAIRLAERAEKVFGEGNVAITGHSLGGGLASAAMLAIDAPGATFNAAGLSDNTLRSLGFTSPNAIRSELADSGQIRRYNVEGELLTGLQQGAVSGMPNAVGHELRVSDPAGRRNPIDLHGGGGDGQAYVESMRHNTARHPGESLFAQPGREKGAEAVFNVLAATGTHLWGLGSDAASSVKQTGGEMVSGLREDLGNGKLALAAGRATGSGVDGVADTAGAVVHRGTDLAGDVVMEGSTWVGGVLRDVGDRVGFGSVADTAATAIERGGYYANQGIDKAGEAVAHVLDVAGDAAQQGWNALGARSQWVVDQAASGAVWLGDKAVEGAQWVGDRAIDAGRWANRHLNPFNWF